MIDACHKKQGARIKTVGADRGYFAKPVLAALFRRRLQPPVATKVTGRETVHQRVRRMSRTVGSHSRSERGRRSKSCGANEMLARVSSLSPTRTAASQRRSLSDGMDTQSETALETHADSGLASARTGAGRVGVREEQVTRTMKHGQERNQRRSRVPASAQELLTTAICQQPASLPIGSGITSDCRSAVQGVQRLTSRPCDSCLPAGTSSWLMASALRSFVQLHLSRARYDHCGVVDHCLLSSFVESALPCRATHERRTGWWSESGACAGPASALAFHRRAASIMPARRNHRVVFPGHSSASHPPARQAASSSLSFAVAVWPPPPRERPTHQL